MLIYLTKREFIYIDFKPNWF